MNITELPRVMPGQSVGQLEKALGTMDRERLALGQKAETLLGYRVLKGAVTGSVAVPTDKMGPLGTMLLQLEIEVLDAAHVLRYQHEEVRRLNQEFTDKLLMSNTLHRYATETWGYIPAKWESTKLGVYTEPIPEFVLAKAVQIKESEPKVEFYVQHVNQPKADPFLVASLDGEVYYVEVWAEPRFEGRLTR